MKRTRMLNYAKSSADRHLHGDEAIRMKGGGFLKRVFHKPLGNRQGPVRSTLRRVEKVARKEVLPIALPILGSVIAGPVGATVGGAAAGAIRSSHNIGKNMMKGALKGLAIGAAMPAAKSAFGALGKGGGFGGLFGGAGGGGNAAAGATPGLSNLPAGNVAKEAAKEKGFFQNFLAKGHGIRGLMGKLGISPLDAALMGTALIGGLKSKEKPPAPHEQQAYNALRNPDNINPQPPIPTYTPYFRQPNPNYGKNFDLNAGLIGEPAFNYAPGYSHGGYVHGGYVHGESGGQDDDVDAYIPEGSFVEDAMTISALGDGNSQNGNKKINELIDRFTESGITKDWNKTPKIHVKLSPGERVIEPDEVEAIGKGSHKNGLKKLQKMRKEIRREKGMKKFIPPKSKSMESYLR